MPDVKNIDSYRQILEELSMLQGDVLGFIDLTGKIRPYVAKDLKSYRQKLRSVHRKDRSVVFQNGPVHVDPADDLDVLLLRELPGYAFENAFDIAVCNGKVFICRLLGDEVQVTKVEDRVTHDAYQKLFVDLWVGADRTHSYINKHNSNVTSGEIRALLHHENIASAHNLHALNPEQEKLIDLLPRYWRTTHHTHQADIEQTFLESFFEFRRAPGALRRGKNYINYSGSALSALVANFLRSSMLSVALVTPCVDLIPDLLKDGGLMPRPLDERLLHNPDRLYERLGAHVASDVIYLVNPNNPTGFCLDEYGAKGFEELARYCRDHRKLLIMDMCFMPFLCRDESLDHVDVYDIFDDYGIDYITIEDTGKFLPTMDMKAAILHVSDGLTPAFERLHTTFLLRHSPFILKTITAFLQSAEKEIHVTSRIITRNLQYLTTALRDKRLPLTVKRRRANVSIAWVHIDDPHLKAAAVRQVAREVDIEVLIGEDFFWDNPHKGHNYLRIALARDETVFRRTIDRLTAILVDLVKNRFS